MLRTCESVLLSRPWAQGLGLRLQGQGPEA